MPRNCQIQKLKHPPGITFHSNAPVPNPKSSQALQVWLESLVLPNQTLASFERMIAGLSRLPGTVASLSAKHEADTRHFSSKKNQTRANPPVNRQSCLADLWQVHIASSV